MTFPGPFDAPDKLKFCEVTFAVEERDRAMFIVLPEKVIVVDAGIVTLILLRFPPVRLLVPDIKKLPFAQIDEAL